MSDDLENFDDFSEQIRRGIEALGWKTPMAVQQKVIPVMRRGSDLIVQAQTGSGKTGAFGLPIVELVDTSLKAPQALVLAPTRELAGQIERELRAMGEHVDLETIAVYGGTAYGPQLDAFKRGAQVVVGTPGRILDHLKSKNLVLDKLKVLIFDEADELLSLGFWPDMRAIRDFTPSKRLTGLFSATMPERVKSLARFFLNEPEFVSLTEGGVHSPDEIEHLHYIVQANEKETMLMRILQFEDPDSAIIFCNTRDDVRYLTRLLQRNEMDADMIQGDMNQTAREKVMARIKGGNLRYLVATDVAARGIDISDLSHVISYTSPDSPETYMHRTGRTGRAGKTGTAISLVSGLDIANFRYLQNVNRMTIPERKLPSPTDLSERIRLRIKVRLDHDLRELDQRERARRQQDLLPLVEELVKSEEGRLELAIVLSTYLKQSEAERERVLAEPSVNPKKSEPRAEKPRESIGDGDADGDRPPDRKRRRRRKSGPRN